MVGGSVVLCCDRLRIQKRGGREARPPPRLEADAQFLCERDVEIVSIESIDAIEVMIGGADPGENHSDRLNGSAVEKLERDITARAAVGHLEGGRVESPTRTVVVKH